MEIIYPNLFNFNKLHIFYLEKLHFLCYTSIDKYSSKNNYLALKQGLFFAMIMEKIKKVYNVKIIFITIGLILLCSASAYSCSIKNGSLRVPIAIDKERQNEALREAFFSIRTVDQEDLKPLKILLIQSRLSTQKEKPTRLPVGLMSLASALRDKDFLVNFFKKLGREEFILKDQDSYPDFMVEILDLQAESEGFDLENYLRKSHPDIVGFTATTPAIDDASEESLIVEKVLPSAIRIIGGPHVSALIRQTLEKTNFQIAVPGEGIETLTELVMEMRLDRPDLFNPSSPLRS
ncbi:MAG: hypothetical protein AUJ70_03210 [Candidatus Omnitrophica bacterium CG1_02_40_15]|nr:MAG: hypothetical protein AUJ70_03210 [Candidatus Omnitrophica bacterium CG1_02_40_15]